MIHIIQTAGDGNHPDCWPIPEASVDATDKARTMAVDVTKTGKNTERCLFGGTVIITKEAACMIK